MRTYFDQNRLMSQADRCFHAADLELAGGVVQVVPAVVERLAPQVAIGAWSWSDQQLARREALGIPGDKPAALRMQRWWCRQWQQPKGLYRVRVLSSEELEIAGHLLGPGGIPADCFPRAQGNLHDDNDANVVAQVIAVGGTLLLTSNMVMVDDDRLQRWFVENHNRWPVPDTGHRLVERVDELYDTWWESHEGAREVLCDSAVAAFWPERDEAPAAAVRENTLAGVRALARGHFRTFAPKLMSRLASEHDLEARITRIRDGLPARMRQGERRRRAMLTGEAIAPLPDDGVGQQRPPGRDPRYDW